MKRKKLLKIAKIFEQQEEIEDRHRIFIVEPYYDKIIIGFKLQFYW